MSELTDNKLNIKLSFNELKESILKHYAKGEYKQSSIIILRDIFRVKQQANEASTSHNKALDIDLVSNSVCIHKNCKKPTAKKDIDNNYCEYHYNQIN